MPEGKDFHDLTANPISDQIGRYNRQFAAPTQNWPPTIRLAHQRVAGFHQSQSKPLGCERTELTDIGADGFQVGQRPARPDYLSHDFGAGASSGVPQVFTQAATSA